MHASPAAMLTVKQVPKAALTIAMSKTEWAYNKAANIEHNSSNLLFTIEYRPNAFPELRWNKIEELSDNLYWHEDNSKTNLETGCQGEIQNEQTSIIPIHR